MKIVHLTSVHQRYDTRIFIKECQSLKEHHNVSLIVADGNGSEVVNGIEIYDVGKLKGRLNRVFKTTWRIFDKAITLNADIYHFHDPELIPVGIKLKKMGKIVIFDSHEDVPQQIRSKPYLNRLTKFFLSKLFAAYENWSCKKFDAIVTATPFIRDKFLLINSQSIDINNYPILGELELKERDDISKKNQICYIGGISKIRGIKEIVESLKYVKKDVRLQLGGTFIERDIEIEVKKSLNWHKVDELGWLDRTEVKNCLNQSLAGLVTLHPVTNYIDALPVKMFEYMSAGLPVIASNFPLWREIIEGNDCGLCVDPLDPKAIAQAIDKLVSDPVMARKMGENGKEAVQNTYNWKIEENKLFSLYEKLQYKVN